MNKWTKLTMLGLNDKKQNKPLKWGKLNLIKNFMTQRNYCADDIIGVLFIMLCITIFAIAVYGILQFTSPETQKSRQCQAIFDTPKSEINEMQQEYYNTNCK